MAHTLSIRCPVCDHMGIDLVLAHYEDVVDAYVWQLGRHRRIGLWCENCQTEFLLSAELTQIIKGG